MQFHLVVPGLAWPTAVFGKLPAQPRLTALPILLGHAGAAWQQPVALETWLAGEFGKRFGKKPAFTGKEAPTAWLLDTTESQRLFGPRTLFHQVAD